MSSVGNANPSEEVSGVSNHGAEIAEWLKHLTNVHVHGTTVDGSAKVLTSTVVVLLQLDIMAYPIINHTVRGDCILNAGTDGELVLRRERQNAHIVNFFLSNLSLCSNICVLLALILFVPFRSRPLDTRYENERTEESNMHEKSRRRSEGLKLL